jgi:hypothetical protein
MSPPSDTPSQFNMHGRYAYLEALGLYCPEMMATLRRDVYPLYIPPSGITTVGPMLDAYIRIECDQSMALLREKLAYWADHFYVRDSWLLDAVMTTMRWAHRNEQIMNCWDAWLYMDEGIPLFNPHLDGGMWLPYEYGGRESWEAFSGRITSDLARQLNEYRSVVNQRYGVASTQTKAHAHWTALFQRGQSAASIAQNLSARYANPTEAVKRAIYRFSSGIGLTLRTRRR